MPSLLEIKNRIDATKSTKKITKAMQLVAASKMKTFQRTSTSVRGYTKELLKALQLGGRNLDQTIYAESRSEGKILFVLLTSDKGLCGAMNTRLIRTLLRSELWNATPEDERMLVTVGRKSKEAARAEGIPTHASFAGLKEKMTTVDALIVIDVILRAWKSGEAKRVVLVSPEYVNAFVFNIEERNYLPMTSDGVREIVNSNGGNGDAPEAAFFEPNQEFVVERVAEQVMQSLFLEAFFQLKATEYSSRMVAMKKATEAADDKIVALTNQFNKARQSAITQQLSELAAANEAMSGEQEYESFEV